MASAKDVARVFEYLGLQAEGTPITNTRLNKLLFYAQGHALATFGRALFSNQIDAWNHGPVVAVVYKSYETIVTKAEEEGLAGIDLSPEEMDVILDVWNQYQGYTAKDLVDMTHEPGTPWTETYKPNEKNLHISLDLIKQFFEKPENKLNHALSGLEKLQTETALPADEYDPDEDATWEALLNDAK